MAEDGSQLLNDIRGQRRTGERIDVGLEMSRIACAGQHHVNAWFIASEAIGRVNEGDSVRFFQDEAEWVLHVNVSRIKLAEIDQFLKRCHEFVGTTQGSTDGKHDLHGNILR